MKLALLILFVGIQSPISRTQDRERVWNMKAKVGDVIGTPSKNKLHASFVYASEADMPDTITIL